MSQTPSKESLALNDIVAKLIEGAEKPGTVAEAAMNLIMGLKDEASRHTPIGNAVVTVLTRIGSLKDDPVFLGIDRLQRAQIMQMAYMAAKMCE